MLQVLVYSYCLSNIKQCLQYSKHKTECNQSIYISENIQIFQAYYFNITFNSLLKNELKS